MFRDLLGQGLSLYSDINNLLIWTNPTLFLIKGLLINSWITMLHKLILGTVILNGTEEERKNEGQQGMIGKKYWQTYRDYSFQCRELVILAVGVFHIQFPLGCVVEYFISPFFNSSWLLLFWHEHYNLPCTYLAQVWMNTWLSAGGNDLKVAEI